jgi:hypothetical protein
MKTAKKVNGIGEIATRMRSRAVEQRVQVRMAAGTFRSHAGELTLRYADRYAVE